MSYKYENKQLITYPFSNSIYWALDGVVVPKISYSNDFKILQSKDVCINIDGVSYFWLKNFLKVKYKNIDVYVFDNHNHAFYFWSDFFISNKEEGWYTIIHIDQHADFDQPDFYLPDIYKFDHQKIFYYTNWVLKINNFIRPIMKFGFVDEVKQIRSEYALTDYVEHLIDWKYILDIDLDYWMWDDISDDAFHKKILNIKKLIWNVDLITISTSPGFIEFEKSQKILDLIFC